MSLCAKAVTEMSGIENRTVIIRRKLRMLASHRHGGGPKPGVRNLGFHEGAAAFGQNLGHTRQPPGQNNLTGRKLGGYDASPAGLTAGQDRDSGFRPFEKAFDGLL